MTVLIRGGVLILMTFQCKESVTDISKSEKICHHNSIPSTLILISHWQKFGHSETPCTYNVVQNINKVVHSDLVFVFSKVRKNLLNWIFILLIILLIFRVERSGVFLFAVILKFVCWTEGTDCFYEGHWLYIIFDFDSTVSHMSQYLIKY